jgi:hypothetical protein
MAANANFCTWNPLSALSGNATVTEGNTKCAFTANYSGIMGTQAVNSGKYYVEFNYAADGNFTDGRLFLGWQYVTQNPLYGYLLIDGTNYYLPDRTTYGGFTIRLRNNSSGGFLSSTGTASASIDNSGLRVASADTIIQCAIDCDNNLMYWGKNNTWYTTNASGSTESNSNIASITGTTIDSAFQGGYFVPAAWMNGASSGTTVIINAGQDSSFAGTKTAGSGKGANGYGDFIYSPPSGYQAICTANLPIDEDIDPAETDDDYPFELVAGTNWVGSGASKALTGLGFQPDLVMIQSADQGSTNWGWFDSTRGVQKYISSNATTAQTTDSNSLTAFGSDGFTVGSTAAFNGSFFLLNSFAWRANAGTTATNDTGDTDTTLQSSVPGGFSIVKWTGTGSATTLGHGLGVAPKLIIVKDTTNANDWAVYHGGVASDAQTDYLLLNSTAAVADDATYWNDTAPTSTVFSVGTNADTNTSSAVMMAYAWAEIEGYSKFSTYIGNGNADGPVVWLGFLPRILWIKRYDSTGDWSVYKWDTTSANAGYMDLAMNPIEARLELNTGNSRDTGEPIDFLSTGFKVKDDDSHINTSGGKYLVCAWGNKPFKYNNTLSTP